MDGPAAVRRAPWLLALVIAVLAGSAPAAEPARVPPGLRTMLDAQVPDTETVQAVAMLQDVPTADDVAALRALGLVAQPLRRLPMVLVQGTMPQLLAAVRGGAARDMYPNRPLQWHSATSNQAMSADQTQALGFDGRGVTVAVVDSGIDAEHPALAERVIRNVRVYGPEYLSVTGVDQFPGVPIPSQPSLVVAFDDLPYNDTDTIGHGTHVAGIVAGDGANDPELVGVAPGASLVGYSTGEILFIFTAVASFDDILATHQDYNIKVVNNSWGSSYSLFDPDAPINVATKALHDAGITVVFSAGNSNEEMTTNPYANAPWVINVASTTVGKERSGFSSSGLMYDNTQAQPLDENLHVHFDGDGLGLSHPDVAAPGSSILSTCTPTGPVVCAGSEPGGSGSASGTSMAAPHIAGLAAVLLQARPTLTPQQIRQVMQLAGEPLLPLRRPTPFWRAGFGFVDAKRALDLVQRGDFSPALLDAMERAADAAMMAARDYRVVASDHWLFVQRGATAAGVESYSYTVDVGADADAIRASVAFPADLGVLGPNVLFEWRLTLADPDGNEVAVSEMTSVGVGVVQADTGGKQGQWTLTAAGELHVAQPALLWGYYVTVSATQLQQQAGKLSALKEGSGLLVGSLSVVLLAPLAAAALLRRRPRA